MIIAVAALAFVMIVSYLWPSEHIKKALAGREDIEIDEVLVSRFADENIDLAAAAELWRSLAECYSVRPGVLRLTDRFTVELNSKRVFQYDDEISCVNLRLTNFYSMRGLNVDLSKLETVEDCIAALCVDAREFRGQ